MFVFYAKRLLAQSALFSIILDILIEENKIDITFLQDFYNKASHGDLTEKEYVELFNSSQFKAFGTEIDKFMEAKKVESRTSALWLQYIDYITTVKLFIFPERTSNWIFHIDAMKRMLNLFAATGHINYAKSTRIYVQEMEMVVAN